METKICKACLKEKELCDFTKDKYTEDGYISKCKECKKNKVPIDKKLNFKTCSSCNKKKNATAFIKNKDADIKCKSCINTENKKLTQINKTCTLCSILKDQVYFSKDKYSSDGYSSACLECRQNKVRALEEDISLGFKTCTGCNILKPLDCYGKDKDAKYGISARCKNCSAEYRSKPEQKEKRKLYRDSNKDYMKEYLKKYFKEHKDIYDNSIKIIIKDGLKICSTCKIEKNVTEFSKKKSNKDGYMCRCKKCASNHHQKTKDGSKERRMQQQRNRRNNDPNKRFTDKVRSAIHNALKSKNCSKNMQTLEILDCNFEYFKKYIQSQFLPWMSWDNFGNTCGNFPDYNCSWDLDHIIPLSYAKTEEELYLLNHWSNFQPLCSKVNRWEKRNNIPILCNIDLKISTTI